MSSDWAYYQKAAIGLRGSFTNIVSRVHTGSRVLNVLEFYDLI